MAGFIKWPVFVFLSLFSIIARSQKLFFEQLTTAEGLPSDYVNTVFKDSKGYLWIGTDKGACRYDGRQFLYHTTDNGLSSNFVYCFDEDPDGNIWMGTFEGGLCKYDGKTITSFGIPTDEFRNIRQIHFNPDKSFFLVTDQQLYYLRSENAVPEKIRDCKAFFSPVNEKLFISGNGTVIYFLEKKGHELSVRESSHHNFTYVANGYLLQTEKNRITTYVTNGKQILFKKEFRLKKTKLPLNSADIKQCFVNDNNLLIATVNGLIFINDRNEEFLLTSENGLGADYIRNIYNDNHDNIYICTFGSGIRLWPRFYLQEYKVDGKVTSIFPSGNGTYISSGKKIYMHFPFTGHFTGYGNTAGGNYTTIYKSPDGKIYVGTLHNFFRLPSEKQLVSLPATLKYSFPANAGVSGILSFNNRLYLSTYGDGVIELNASGKQIPFFRPQGLGIIESLVQLKNSFAALTYSSGIILFTDTLKKVNINTRQGLLSNTAYTIFQEIESKIWIGTFKGLNLYENGKISGTYTSEKGLVGTKVLCIFRDAGQRFWVLSEKYLHLFENDKLRAIRSHPVVYDPGKSINRAAYDQQHDLLYIGLNDALMTVDMKKIVPDTAIVYPGLKSILSDTINLRPSNQVMKINPRPGKLSFIFGQQFYSVTKNYDLYYKLSGFDDEWKLLDKSSRAGFQKLPAGNYSLLAKTINADGYESPEIKLMTIEVLPPLWKRAWFIALFISLLLAVFFYTGHIISNRKYKQKLKHLQEEYQLQLERERIARELHDNVGSHLTYLINKIDDDYILLSDKKEADKLNSFARATMQELRQTIWALDKKDIKLYELENKIQQLTELHNNESVSVQYFPKNKNSNQAGILLSLKALNIYRIIQEALNNAVKYSGAHNINIRSETSHGNLIIEISDNGKGFDTNETVQGYGLRNMKNRANEMHAGLTIVSKKEKGTSVSLTVPLD